MEDDQSELALIVVGGTVVLKRGENNEGEKTLTGTKLRRNERGDAGFQKIKPSISETESLFVETMVCRKRLTKIGARKPEREFAK